MRQTLRQRKRSLKHRGGKNDILFPRKAKVDYSKLLVTDEGKYSVTRRRDSELMMKYIKKLIKDVKSKHITDLTGNIGGDTINFALHFKHVDSIEIDPVNFQALKNNVEVFGLKNVTLHEGDATQIYGWKTDVLYIDAPWGGPDYKLQKNLDLFVGNRRIDEYIQEILARPTSPDYILLKLPANYNFERLEALPVREKHKLKIRGYFLVVLIK